MTANGMDPLAFPGYRLVVVLGTGNNGRVWRARELESQRLVAMKIYRQELLRRAGFLNGSDAAVASVKSFAHPGAGAVYGLVEARAGGSLALVMELLGGEVLTRALQRNVRFAVPRALRLLREMADALAAAHAVGLTAGFLHPGHVVIAGESARLLGLGWSAVEGLPAEYRHAPEEGRFAPAVYAAPELLAGARPDGASDVFATGALLYHMLTGLPPFRARDMAGLKLERSEGLRWPRGVDSVIPAGVIGLVGRMLELDRIVRPSAADVAAAAGGFLSEQGASASGPTRERLASAVSSPLPELPPADSPAVLPPPRPASRLRDVLLGAVAATLLIAAGLGLGRLVWLGPQGVGLSRPTTEQPASPEARVDPARPDNPDGGPPAQPTASAAEEEVRSALAALEDPDPAGRAKARDRLVELAAKHRGTPWGESARERVEELAAADRKARQDVFDGLIARVHEMEKAYLYGEALKLLDSPPAELAGTEHAVSCARRAGELRRRAESSFEELAARAERSVADGDLATAILDYQGAAGSFGIEELVERARKRARELGEEQERRAARQAEDRERLRREEARAVLAKGVAAAHAHAAAFSYGQAGAELAKLADDPAQTAADRELAAAYARLVAEESELFARACRAVTEGRKELTISQGGPEILIVKKMDAKGMTAESDAIHAVFLWSQIPDAQIYRAVKLTIDMTDAGEQLALACFAWHRGQRMEMENGIKIAAELDPAVKERAAGTAELLAEIDALLSPRRTETDRPGEAPSPSDRRSGS